MMRLAGRALTIVCLKGLAASCETISSFLVGEMETVVFDPFGVGG